jgi:succinyldiaminopimelate transaminase
MGFSVDALGAFPWDALVPYEQRAREHPDGIINLSVGTPVDPTPELMQEALAGAANAPGYPPTVGTPALREAIVDHYRRRRHVEGLSPANVLPTIGSKEMVALLPSMLGLGRGDTVVHPEIAYPTYAVGAHLAGAQALALDLDGPRVLEELDAQAAGAVRLIWVNSPANPDGAVTSREALAGIVDWARERGIVVASDECYAELAWQEPWVSEGVPSVLDARVNGGDLTGLLALYSLSKQSNAAGYRIAWIAGDRELISGLAHVRKQIGLMMPGPCQAAAVTGLSDDAAVAAQRERYGARREVLLRAVRGAGYQVARSEAGLYLWFTTPDRQDGWQTVADLAELGILVAPGSFYGPAGAAYVRMALTECDQSVIATATRLAGA